MNRESDTGAPRALVAEFVGPRAEYYADRFRLISQSLRFRPTFNPAAALFGVIWFAARGLWHWFIPFLLAEAFAVIFLALGLISDLGAESRIRAEEIRVTLDERREQLEESIAAGADNVAALQRVVGSLEDAVAGALQDAQTADESKATLFVLGLVALFLIRAVQGVLANWALEHQFTLWRSDRRIASGLSAARAAAAGGIAGVVFGLSAVRFATPGTIAILETFPTEKALRIGIGDSIRSWVDRATVSGEPVFDAITFGVRSLLDGLETVFVGTPWPVVMLFIAILAWRAAGIRVAIFAVAGLLYLGLLGFWDKAMATVALLGAAACVSISLGIPLGILCARRPRVYSVVRPVLDFMQTMPSFVYLIPVIAFFGTGKPAAILATLIFGSPPVIRLTVLGLQNVPAHVREAAVAFGATPMYLLFRVDLPLAARTIMAGVNQTIMLSLAMVVVASLIGAKGLGEDVLEALQYASTGEGLLAGFAILFCAMILDRVIQGRRR